MAHKDLFIDLETYSSVDIGKAGSYKYARSEDYKILLFAYAYDLEPVQVVDLACGELVPAEVLLDLYNPKVIKHAFNAAFEWYGLNQKLNKHGELPLSQWRCTMIHSLYCGFPGKLESAGPAVGLPEDKRKLTTGRALIRYFCVPCKPTKSNGGRTRNLPQHDMDKWNLFKEYNAQDVETEREIWKRLRYYEVPEKEWELWRDDVRMNARGVCADRDLITGALSINAQSEDFLLNESGGITHLDNPNSPTQVRLWLEGQGLYVPKLDKATVADLLSQDIPADCRRVLEIRQQLGKTSIKKYVAMQTAMNTDDRDTIKGISQFYGANRTGRYAGRLVQMQNLPRNYLGTLDTAREVVKSRNYEALKLLYGNVPDTLSQLIRTSFVPSEGRHFVVADFSAIEARVIAWLAGEEWVNKVFATTGKIYEATAAQMFHVPEERIKKGNPEYALRQKGKIATLALGYQGGPSAMVAMGALNMGIPEEELPEIVEKWRSANPHIVSLWYRIGEAAINAVSGRGDQEVNGLTFRLEGDIIYGSKFMTIELPTGRKLYYPGTCVEMNRFDRPAVHYMTVNQQTRKWELDSTYGGKLTENCVQAIARDCLTEILNRIKHTFGDRAPVVFHVHDEVICDAEMDITVDDLCDLMAEPIEWAPGLILKGAGFEGNYYMKD